MVEALQLADSIQKNCEIHLLEKGLPEDSLGALNNHQFYQMNDVSILKGKNIGPGRYCNQPECWATENFMYGGLCYPTYCSFSISRVNDAIQNPVTDNAGLYRIDLTYRPASGWTKTYTQLNLAAVNLQAAFRAVGYQ